jgi:hypothetical protein
MGCPSTSVNGVPISRASKSDPPPAANGVSNRIGLFGYFD